MAILSLIFNRPKRTRIISPVIDPKGEPISFDIDATTSLSHDMSSTITKYPIEDGGNVTDHMTLNNKKLTITGMVSENPLTLIQSLETIVKQRVLDKFDQYQINRGIKSGLAASIGGLLSTDSERLQNSFRFLEELRDKKIAFSVVTELKNYENMMISSLGIPRTNKDGDSFIFTMTVEQVNFVASQLFKVDFDNASSDTQHTVGEVTNTGKQENKGTTEDVTKQAQSILFKLGKAIGLGQ